MLNDSGNRTKSLSGGLKDIDINKGRVELLPMASTILVMNSIKNVDQISIYDNKIYYNFIYDIPDDGLHNLMIELLGHIKILQDYIVIFRHISKSKGNIIHPSIDVVHNISKHCVDMFSIVSNRYNLTIASILHDLSNHFRDGAVKYVEDNWRYGVALNWMLDSMIRHLFKWNDRLTDERHDRAFLWYVLVIIEYMYKFESKEMELSIVDTKHTIRIVKDDENV